MLASVSALDHGAEMGLLGRSNRGHNLEYSYLLVEFEVDETAVRVGAFVVCSRTARDLLRTCSASD